MSKLSFCIFLMLFILIDGAQAETSFRNLGYGWMAFTQQSEPFDRTKFKIIHISKGGFIFRCNELNMRATSYGFESLSFHASLKYVVDSERPVDKSGGYSTYLGGSDIVTDSRYYHFKLNDSDIDAFKNGGEVKVAGQYSGTGWFTKSLNLMGFTKAYNEMCD